VAYLEDLHEWCSARLAETVAHLLPLEVKEAPEASREPHRAPLRVGFSVSKAVDVTAAAKNTEFLERRFDSLKSALEAHDGRALLLGAPGAGKTTSLLAFARDAAVARLSDPSNPLPVLASIPSWSSKAELRPWLERVSPWPRQTSDNLLFLLDGLDELGGPRRKDPSNERSELYDPRKLFLEALERDIPGGSIVVTSRDREYKEIRGPASFGAIVTVQPLSDAQVQAYLTARHQASVLELARHDEDFVAIGPDAAAPSEGNVFDQGFVFDRYIARRFVHEASVADRLWFDEQETRARLATLGAWMWIDFDAGIDSAFQYWVVTERTSLDATRAFELIGPDAERFVRFCARMNLLREERDGGFAFQHLKLRDFCALPALFQLVDWRVNQLPLPSSPNPLRLDLREYPAAVAADHMTRIADAARAALLSVARGGIDLVETARRLGRVAKPAANEARLRYSSSPELVIPDSNPSLVHSTIRVDEAGRLAEITVHLDIEHAWIGDLKIRLHSPSGAVVTLHDRQGGAAKRANSPATSVLHQSLAALRGTDYQGVWTLETSDHVEGDGGVLHGWALDMRVGT
jgi:subtilisin-like proprotein convertase family protein